MKGCASFYKRNVTITEASLAAVTCGMQEGTYPSGLVIEISLYILTLLSPMNELASIFPSVHYAFSFYSMACVIKLIAEGCGYGFTVSFLYLPLSLPCSAGSSS